MNRLQLHTRPRRPVRLWLVSCLAVIAGLTIAANVYAQDGASLFEARCASCHKSSQELAVMTLVVDGGVLRSSVSGKDIREFLPRHRGHPDADQTLALYDLLFSDLKSCPNVRTQGGGGFEARCAICHGTARELASQKLVREGDIVRGRYSGQELSEFLDTHARICTDDRDYFFRMLSDLAPSIEP
ncbi:MAG TPA: hypothetical protein VIN57_05735 [Magnetovibrio sp.]